MIVAGVELHRRGLQGVLADFVERTGLPVVATLTGKSVMSERHPAYLGIYEGAMSSEAVRDRVEKSDLLLMLGVTLNEIDTGIYTAKLNSHSTIRAALNEVVISAHRYPGIALEDFLGALAGSVSPSSSARVSSPKPSVRIAFPEPDRRITTARLVERLNRALSNDMIVVCDVGDCLFAAIDLRVHEQSEFLASAFYTTMGFAVPAALGAQIARPDRRALVLVGDGAFQMTGTELSTHARLGLNPIVVVFNNGGYSTERCILEGPFNDINPWRFDRLGELFGPLAGYEAGTESEFEEALVNALNNDGMPSIINVHLAANDSSEAMKRLAEHLQSKIKREM
jgi:indolepyruvate decarboxylase